MGNNALQGETVQPWIVGGGYWWQELSTFSGGTADGGIVEPDGYIDTGIAWMWQVDDQMLLLYDIDGDKVPIPAEDAVNGPAPLTAWYEVQVVRYLTPADRLLESPI